MPSPWRAIRPFEPPAVRLQRRRIAADQDEVRRIGSRLHPGECLDENVLPLLGKQVADAQDQPLIRR